VTVFDPTSRYAGIEEATHALPDGRTVPYKRRRFLPRSDRMPQLAAETVRPADRLDLIAVRSIGDPEQYWRICDANDALDPEALLRVGRRLRIASPEP
jgi:hypothetical protein